MMTRIGGITFNLTCYHPLARVKEFKMTIWKYSDTDANRIVYKCPECGREVFLDMAVELQTTEVTQQ